QFQVRLLEFPMSQKYASWKPEQKVMGVDQLNLCHMSFNCIMERLICLLISFGYLRLSYLQHTQKHWLPLKHPTSHVITDCNNRQTVSCCIPPLPDSSIST